MSRVFISYRRGDSAGHTGRLLDSLEQRIGAENFFRDIESLEAGVDFPSALDDALSRCDVVLVMIGRDWASSSGPRGRRLDEPEDFVRMEVASALSRQNVRVIPVLVDGGSLPDAKELPEDLRALVRRNAIELSDTRWDYDVGRLAETLRKLLGLADHTAKAAPAPVAEGAAKSGAGVPRSVLAIGGVVLAAVITVVLYQSGFFEPNAAEGGVAPGDASNRAAGGTAKRVEPEDIGGRWYQALVAQCKREPTWKWDCVVPAIPHIDPFLPGEPCACTGRILRHKETGLYRCEQLPPGCGGVSFEKTLGYPPQMDWYTDATPR